MKTTFILIFSLCLGLFQLPANGASNETNTDVPKNAKTVRPLLIGSAVPDVTLKNPEGKDFKLAEEIKGRQVVLIFYRGGWCPYCNMHLMELQSIDPQLRQLGYRIIAVSPDLPEKLQVSVGKHKLSYTLLSDSRMAAAKAFGVAFSVDKKTREIYKKYKIDLNAASGEKHNLLPVPSVFIIGKDGKIKFSYANPDYKIRLDSATLMAAAKAALSSDGKTDKKKK
jgi:peroxiredoxin